MKKYMPFILMLGLQPLVASSDQSITLNEERQVAFAERVVTIELVRALSPAIRGAKEKCGDACADTGAAELAIGLMGVSRGEASARALVNLLGVRLDGGGAEERGCQMLNRGPDTARYLKQLKPGEVVKYCRSNFLALRKREIAGITDVTVEQVCHSESEISNARNEFLKAVTADVACEQ